MTRDELESDLGPRERFILSVDNQEALAAWVHAIGMQPVQIAAMSAVQMANLYHERGPSEQRSLPADITEAIRLTAQALAAPVTAETLRPMVEQILLDIAPRPLEIITPTHSVVMDGQMHYATADVIQLVALDDNVMMVGPAGCGKTTIAKNVATALQLPFFITSSITDTHELMGYTDGYGKYNATPFRIAYEHGGLWLADEIDAWEAGPLLAANSALANGYATFPDDPKPVFKHPDFRVVASANTYGTGADRVYIGRNQLDAASLDRFAMVAVDYDLSLERLFANGSDEWLNHVWKVREIVNEKKIRHVVSSRAILRGARSLAAGFSWEKCEAFHLFKGMSAADRGKINL